MGTRSGDLDPALPAHLHRELGWSIDDVDSALNRESGLKGLTGHNDFREVLSATRRRATRLARWPSTSTPTASASTSAPTMAVLGTVDAVVFTGGVGQHNAGARGQPSGRARLGHRDRSGTQRTVG